MSRNHHKIQDEILEQNNVSNDVSYDTLNGVVQGKIKNLLYPHTKINKYGKIAYIDSDECDMSGVCGCFLYKNVLQRVDIYNELESIDLNQFSALVFPVQIDEIYLARFKDKLIDFVKNKKIIISFMSNFSGILPYCGKYIASPIKINDRVVISNHSMFEDITSYDLNYRRGVKGFFNRGFFDISHFPRGHNVEVILKDNDGKCVAFIDRDSYDGSILSTAHCDLLGFGIFDNNTARRMGLNLMKWIGAELDRLHGVDSKELDSKDSSDFIESNNCNKEHKTEDLESYKNTFLPNQNDKIDSTIHKNKNLRNAIITGGANYNHYFFINKNAKYDDFFDEKIYVLDLDSINLHGFDYIVIATRLNASLLLKFKDKFMDYINNGGHIVSFGEVRKPYLPNITWQNYPVNFWWWTINGADLPLYEAQKGHALFKNMDISMAKWHYHGAYYPSGNIEKIIVNELGESILYKDKNFKGAMYITTLDPDFHIGQGFMDRTEPFLDNFLEYVESDIANIANIKN